MTKVNLETPLAEKLIGDSPKMRHLRDIIAFAGRSDSSIMITGPSGSGKEVVAQAIHAISNRRNGPNIAVNCGALPENLIESVLFGHEKGSFTGAVKQHIGLFEQADGGTIFLDEIGDMPIDMQVKLLRVLETRTVNRVGGNRNIRVNARVITATHKQLRDCISNKSFREDLYYRLCVVPVEVPALCDRTEDIPALVAHFLKNHDQRHPLPVFTPQAFAAMGCYDWPGNVRELRNVVERASVFFAGKPVLAEDIAMLVQSEIAPKTRDTASDNKAAESATQGPAMPDLDKGEPGVSRDDICDLNLHLQFEERRIIMDALDRSHGVVSQAARAINVKRTTLIDKIRKHDIDWQTEDRAHSHMVR